MSKLRKYLIAGLLVWLPVIATVFIINMVLHFIGSIYGVIPSQYQPHKFFGHTIPGIGLILTVLIILATGILTTNFLGKKLFFIADKIIHKIPLIRSIYSAASKLCHSLLSSNSRSFKRVLLIEFPQPDMWMIAFETCDKSNFNQLATNMITVFVPCSPNPTSGFMLFVDKNRVREIDISVEQAFKMVVSIGVISPEQLQNEESEFNSTP